MKRITLVITILLATLEMAAQEQEITSAITVFPNFQPATVYLTSGRKMEIPLANIFLKNGALLYMSGDDIKEANMKTLLRAEFGDKVYIRIDSMLACQVDSIGDNALFRAKIIDIKAYKQSRANSANITNLDLSYLTDTSASLSYNTIEATDKSELQFPIESVYFYRLDDQFIRVHERTLKRTLPKEKRRIMESVMNMPGFTWTNEKYLMMILEKIQ
ncbi:MAG: hypothetical protein J5658_13075 [Prevotella sp.]|nr:hypothetical protein [Prevotella sp.]